MKGSAALAKELHEADIIIPGEKRGSHERCVTNYVEIRNAYANPNLLWRIAGELYPLLPTYITCIAGEGDGAKPLVDAVGLRYRDAGLKLTRVNITSKDHGTGSRFAGHIPTRQDCVAILDGVSNIGGSLLEIIEILEPRTNIAGCYVLIRRKEIALPYPLHYLYTLDEFLSHKP